MHFHDFTLAIIAFFSELIGTISGFGSSTFFVPIGLYFESFKLILALTAILHCLGNTFKIFVFRKDFHWPSFIRLAIPSILFTGLGAWLTSYFYSTWMIVFLGVLLMLLPPLVLIIKAPPTNL
ncbi:MAG: sulfite exporter TauE/SafE family protein, partial [Bdellovibrionota bacterium]